MGCRLRHCSTAAIDYLEVASADVVVVQEVKLADMAPCLAAERAAKRAGWSMSVVPAVRTERNGISAGVAVAARSHYGVAEKKGPCEGDPACSVGRLAANQVSIACKGGVHFVSMYLWCSEGLSSRNLDLLQTCAELIARLHGPWVLAADFNIEPAVLQQCGWLDLVKGKIIEPPVATCGKKKYDYFVVASGLAQSVVGCAVVHDAGLHPHSPVRLFLKGRPCAELARVLAAHRKFTADIAAGCLHDPSQHDVGQLADDAGPEAVARLAFGLAEQELSDLCGHEPD